MKRITLPSVRFLFLLLMPSGLAAQAGELVLQLPFDEGAGVLARSVAVWTNGVKPNPSQWVPGKYGSALAFDGVSSTAIGVPLPETLKPGNSDFTLAAWVRAEAIRFPEFQDKRRRIVSLVDEWPRFFVVLDLLEGGFLRFEMSQQKVDGGPRLGFTVRAHTPLVEKQWVHVAVVCDRQSRILALYLDGRLDGEENAQPGFDAAVTGGKPLTLGSTWQNFRGALDEMRLYRRALSAKEIAALPGDAFRGKLSPEGATSTPSIRRVGVRVATNYYVSLEGSDAWSGGLPAPNAARSDGPFATVRGAQEMLRGVKEKGAFPGPVSVWLRGGIHRLDEPLRFRPADSGDENGSIRYAAYPGEEPVLSGGKRITGWAVHEGRVWKAALPEAKSGGWIFRRLYVNGHSRTMARSPNEGAYFRIDDRPPEGFDERTAFEFKPGDLRKWPRLDEIDAVIFINWESALLPLKDVDESRSLVSFKGPMRWPAEMPYPQGKRYYVENAREFLDAPGEWWLDRHMGVLYYFPLPGERMDQAVVTAPRLDRLLFVTGDEANAQPVAHLRFEGLRFEHGNHTLGPQGHADWQSAQSVPAALVFKGAKDCALERCGISQVAGYAVEVDSGCEGMRVVQCEISDLGAGGVLVRAGSTGTVIHNNLIHDGGQQFKSGTPILVQDSGRNVITHNEVCDFDYLGISVGWKWGFMPSAAHSNRIESNHIHHVGRGVLTDLAGIYTLGPSWGTVIRGNHIHDIWDDPEGYLACGIYPDEGSSGLLIEDNLVYRTSHGGLHVHFGRENAVRNNVFAFGRDAQVHLGRGPNLRDEKDRAKWQGGTNSSILFERNVVLYGRGDLFRRDSEYTGDSNLFWDVSGRPQRFAGNRTLEEWRALGRDPHSLLADPGFVNPSNGNFNLKPGSPLPSLGIRVPELSRAGLEGDSIWRSRATALSRPESWIPERVGPPEDAVEEDFESLRPGKKPRYARFLGEVQGASVQVTEEAAASGKRSLKVIDAPGLKNIYDPHFYWQLKAERGTARASFDLRLEPGATGYHEWRDWSRRPYVVGPSLVFREDGMLLASSNALLSIPRSVWVHLEIECGLGDKANGNYVLTVTPHGKVSQRFPGIACEPGFGKLTWFGYSSEATNTAVFYLDNLRLKCD